MSARLENAGGYQVVLDHLGDAGSRQLIATPALVCDFAVLMENIERMATVAALGGVSLRPHLKSHKSAFIARRQLDAGAVGLSFAKLAEAEAVVERLAADGDPSSLSVLLTSPIVGISATTRAAALARRCELMIVVDHVGGVDEVAAVLDEATSITVLCDVDVGQGRTGVTGPREALAVVARIVQCEGLEFGGVQGYGGHLQHLVGRDERRAATVAAMNRLRVVVDELEDHGHEVGLRTGGGTGTTSIDIELGLLNELQPGSYVFMDREYRDALRDDPEGRFGRSLSLATSVVSANHTGFVTVDAGLKSMATDAGAPTVIGLESQCEYRFFGDEHGLITNPSGPPFERGDRLHLLPAHCDPTVDRYDDIWLVEGDVVIGVIDVVARGCSQ